MEKVNTHIVIKRQDALKYLTEVEYQALEQMLCTISQGRNKEGKKPINTYYVCNIDEPYAEVVHGIIIGGEAVKEQSLSDKQERLVASDEDCADCLCRVCARNICNDSRSSKLIFRGGIMQEVFEKIIEKLQELNIEKQSCSKCAYREECDAMQEKNDIADDVCLCTMLMKLKAIEIVKQAAEKFGTDTNVGSNGWIPCSEPPKDDRYVLLSFDNFSIPMVGRYEEGEKGGSYYIGDEMEPCVTQDIFVNAWQPLPLPYTKGE